MSKESAKRTFIVRTVAAILAIYVIVLSSVTYQSAKQKKADGMTQTGQALDQLWFQLKDCESQAKSKAVEDGLNLAKADRVMRKTDGDIGMWDTQKRKDSLILYKAVKNKKGDITSLKRVKSDVHVLYDNTVEDKSQSLVVLEDWISKKDAALLTDKFAYTDEYILNGYDTGEFFEPTRIRADLTTYNPKTDTDDTHNVNIKTGHKKRGQKESELRLKSVYAESIDSKSWQEEDETWEKLEKLAAEFTLEGSEDSKDEGSPAILDYSHLGFVNSAYAGFMSLNTGDYWIGYYVEDHPLINGVYSMLWVYFIATVIFALIGLVLIGSYCRVIDTQYETEERRRKMSDAMAHEMKTPLGIIKNYSEVLSEEEDGAKRKEYLNTIVAETDSMNNMIVRMLDLSKMEAGTYPMELSVLSVRDITEKVISRTKILAEKKDLQVQMDCMEDTKILADEKLLTESICNLMLNAIIHAEEHSTILINAEKEKETARFEIFNCGQPVAKKDQSKIWDSFYRGDTARARNKGGNGLGLSIVKNACILHQGSCGFENKENGVSFWIEIPSQEDLKKSEKRNVGPILNLEQNGVNLSGLFYAVVGTLLWLIPDAILLLIVREGAAAEQPLWPVLISIPGWILCWLAVRKLAVLRKLFRLSYGAVVIAGLGIAGYCIFSAAGSALISTIFLLLMFVGIALYLSGISLICREFLNKFGKRRLGHVMLVCLIALLICGVLWVFCTVFFPNMLIGPAMGGLSFIIALVNLWFWYDTFKRFHGKEEI